MKSLECIRGVRGDMDDHHGACYDDQTCLVLLTVRVAPNSRNSSRRLRQRAEFGIKSDPLSLMEMSVEVISKESMES